MLFCFSINKRSLWFLHSGWFLEPVSQLALRHAQEALQSLHVVGHGIGFFFFWFALNVRNKRMENREEQQHALKYFNHLYILFMSKNWQQIKTKDTRHRRLH